MTLTLPIPALALRPNGRAHPMKKSSAVRKARELAFFATLTAFGAKAVPTRITFSDAQKLGLPTGTRTHQFYHRLSNLLLPGPFPPITSYTLTYHFKTKRHWDDDNAIGAAKAYRDGIAHALRIDDRTILLAALPLLLTDPTAPRLQIHLHSLPQP